MYKTLLSLMFFEWIYLSFGSFPARNPLHEAIKYVQAEETRLHGGTVSGDQTQLLLDRLWETTVCPVNPSLCLGCLGAIELFHIIKANVSSGLQERDFERASVVLLHHLQHGNCKMTKERNTNITYVDYLFDIVTTEASSALTLVISRRDTVKTFANLPLDLSFSEEQLHYILEVIKESYTPTTVNKCFTSKDVFQDIGINSGEGANERDVEKLSSVVITNLLRGDCIGESQVINPKSFTDSIFENYGTFGTIWEQEFDQMLKDLGIGGTHYNHRDFPSHYQNGQIYDRRRRRAAAERTRHGQDKINANVSANITKDHTHGETTDHSSACFTSRQLLDLFEIEKDIITSSTFYDMCPSLIQQIVSKACKEVYQKTEPNQSAIVYVWGALSVFLVTFWSMIGIIIIPLTSVKVYTGIMHLFVALAISTLSGDALLHLIPEALGLHTHGERRQPEATDEQVLGKVMVVVAAIYAFFLFERLMMVCLGKSSQGHGHGPTANPKVITGADNSPAMYQNGNTLEMQDVSSMPSFSDVDNIDQYSTSLPCTENILAEEDMNNINIDSCAKYISDHTQYQPHTMSETLLVSKKQSSFKFTNGLKAVSVMVLIGDAVHNMTDGLAIGVAFTLDIYVGISTSIAVFCHELPHEIGDFAVLLKNGLSFRTAFFWSLMSNLGGFIGVFVGIELGTLDSLHQWIFAATAGMFLYIALVDLMPEITHDPAGFSSSVFLMHNIGLVVGWTLMILLAYFESIMTGALSAPDKHA